MWLAQSAQSVSPRTTSSEQRHRPGPPKEQGIPVVIGYAELPAVLDHAHLNRALVLVIAIPDPMAGRRIIDYARKINPDLEIVVRAHHVDEQQIFLDRGATEALIGEVELALEMARFALERFGVDFIDIQRMMREKRSAENTRDEKPALP